MTPKDLTDKIAARVKAEVDRDWNTFSNEVDRALQGFLKGSHFPVENQIACVKRYLARLESHPIPGLPQAIWARREEGMLKDVLSQMDTLQRLLMAPEPTSKDPLESVEPAAPPAEE